MDVSERQAKLNTEVRFHNFAQALPLAYALRLELELLENPNEKQKTQLEKADLTVRQLERLTEGPLARIVRRLYEKFVPHQAEEPLPPLHEVEDSNASSESKEES